MLKVENGPSGSLFFPPRLDLMALKRTKKKERSTALARVIQVCVGEARASGFRSRWPSGTASEAATEQPQ
jgi:hypothetical protein